MDSGYSFSSLFPLTELFVAGCERGGQFNACMTLLTLRVFIAFISGRRRKVSTFYVRIASKGLPFFREACVSLGHVCSIYFPRPSLAFPLPFLPSFLRGEKVRKVTQEIILFPAVVVPIQHTVKFVWRHNNPFEQ